VKYLFLITCGLWLTGCACGNRCVPTERQTHELLHANLWMQTSAEYAAVSIETYFTAEALLPAAIADSNWTGCLEQGENYQALPPAIILDVDETVLDNTAFESRLIRDNDYYRNENWLPWCREAKATAIPGARDFLKRAEELGVKIFYVTNRGMEIEQATCENIINQGLPLDTTGDYMLTKGEREDWGSDKTSRRKWVADSHRVIMLFGDNFNDFAPGTQVSPAERVEHSYKNYWGLKWFMLANPDYGDWESAIYNYKWPKTSEEQLKMKYDALKTLDGK
jgi:5'-nucleotidase (lipoprotein e(P4) family)